MPTIDERLEKLTERHEALTQSVEILTADLREMAVTNKQRFRQIATTSEHLVRIVENRQLPPS